MLTHVVLFTFDDDAIADEAVAKLAAMDGRIDVVESLSVGRDTVGSARSWDVGLVVTVADHEALEAYATHPVHTPVVEWIRAHATASAACDYVT